MENATKALLIAAAVLIAILIISFSLIIYNMAAETVGNVNLSEAEMTQFNSKFTAYEGKSVSGAQVNALLTTVLTHNQQETKNGSNRTVEVEVDGAKKVVKDSTSIEEKVPTGNNYTVICTLDKGLVKSVKVTVNTTSK
jgi:hypothetical protein